MKKYGVYYDDNEMYPLADELINCFSKFLADKGIIFLNEDTDEYQLKNKCAIYGEDFRTLQEMIQTVLDGRIK